MIPMLTLSLKAATLIATGLVFGLAIHRLFPGYLSWLVVPPLRPAAGWAVFIWGGIALLSVATRGWLMNRINTISIADARQQPKYVRRLFVIAGASSEAATLLGLPGLLLPLWGRFVGFARPPWSGTAALAWLTLLGVAEIGRKLYSPMMGYVLMPDADQVLERDSRAPVVYLRAFDVELLRATPGGLLKNISRLIKHPREYALASHRLQTTARPTFGRAWILKESSRRGQLDPQAAFAAVMDSVGPYIAIGRPGEGDQGYDIGAAKRYVSDDQWQDVVKAWIDRAAVLVFEVGPTKGLLWELSYAMQHPKKNRVLMILPWDSADYEQFRTIAASVLSLELPTQRPASRLLAFDSEGKPWPLPATTTLDLTLQPFFKRLGIVPI